MKNKIHSALASSKADYTEIRIEEKESVRVAFRGKNLEVANANSDRGGMVRCLVKDKGWGVATFNDLDDLRSKVDQAYRCARVGSVLEPIELSPAEPVVTTLSASMRNDFRLVPLSDKKALVEYYNGILLGFDGRIVDTRAIYADSFSRIIFANSEGSWIEQEKPSAAFMAVAIAKEGDNVQQGIESVATNGEDGWDVVLGRDELARKAARTALGLLTAKPVKAGRYTVVANPKLASVFIHEAFGHLSEADFIYENPKAREMMTLGRRFGKGILNVYDDGSIPGLRGTTLYDDEGTPARRNWLIREGVLVGRLHSRQTAAKMGESPTGNARAVSYRFAPIVRMTNTAIDNGTTSFEDMIGDIELGIYACDYYGGETKFEDFSFSSGHAWMIRDGKIAEMAKDVTLAGNLFTTLDNVDAVGNDFAWDESPSGCGKFGQVPLHVGQGAPHIRVRDVVIGGE